MFELGDDDLEVDRPVDGDAGGPAVRLGAGAAGPEVLASRTPTPGSPSARPCSTPAGTATPHTALDDEVRDRALTIVFDGLAPSAR